MLWPKICFGNTPVRQRVSPSHVPETVPPVPILIPGELSEWMQDRQSDLQEATSVGNFKRVLELTSLQSQAAEKLAELRRRMVSRCSSAAIVVGRIDGVSKCVSRVLAFWASWADCLDVIHQRHPDVADQLVRELEGDPQTPCLQPAASAARELDRQFRDGDLFGKLDDTAKALRRSQGGSGAGLASSTCPTCRATQFLVLLLRRLRLPPSLTFVDCRCGLPLDACGHHSATCARAGVLGRNGYALHSATAQVCREAGGKVTTNVMVRDLDLAVPNAADARRLEVVVDGLPLFRGAQLPVDTTLVCALHATGLVRRGAAHTDGARSCSTKEGGDLSGAGGASGLSTPCGSPNMWGGMWPPETQPFLTQLASAEARAH